MAQQEMRAGAAHLACGREGSRPARQGIPALTTLGYGQDPRPARPPPPTPDPALFLRERVVTMDAEDSESF